MKRFVATLVLLAAAILAAPAAAQQPSEFWANDGESLLVLDIKTGNTGQYMINVNEAWLPVDPKTFAAEDENGYTAVIKALRPPFRAKLQYRRTGEDETITIIGLKVIEQYNYNEIGDIVRPGHGTPIVTEEQDTPGLILNLRDKERVR